MPVNYHDLSGQRFGRLVALNPTDERFRSSVGWLCLCDCGKRCVKSSYALRRGIVRSCGCLQDEARRDDISGAVRGKLTAIRPTDKRRGGRTVWEWRCECGAAVFKTLSMVKDGASTMCPTCARALKATQAESARNAQPRDEHGLVAKSLDRIRDGTPDAHNSSGVRGVSWHLRLKKWQARIQKDRHTVTLGYYDTIEEAAAARRRAVQIEYGCKEDNS